MILHLLLYSVIIIEASALKETEKYLTNMKEESILILTMEKSEQVVNTVNNWIQHFDVKRLRLLDIEEMAKMMKKRIIPLSLSLKSPEIYIQQHYGSFIYPIEFIPFIEHDVIANNFVIFTTVENRSKFKFKSKLFIVNYFTIHKSTALHPIIKPYGSLVNAYSKKLSTKPVLILDVDNTFCGIKNSEYYGRHDTRKFIMTAQIVFDVYLVSLSNRNEIYYKLKALKLLDLFPDRKNVIGRDTLTCYYISAINNENFDCLLNEFYDPSIIANNLKHIRYKPIHLIPYIEDRITMGNFVIIDDKLEVYSLYLQQKVIQISSMTDLLEIDDKNDYRFKELIENDMSILFSVLYINNISKK